MSQQAYDPRSNRLLEVNMGLAPFVNGPERDRSAAYVPDTAQNGRRRGPLRFEEGIATDTDVPGDFRVGAYVDTSHPEPRTEWKHSDQTQRERAHMGSSTWIEAPSMLQEFVHGTQANGTGYGFERESEGNKRRPNRAVVND
jgi:hypothetical protein